TTGNYEKFYEQYQSQIEALEQSVHQHQREVKHIILIHHYFLKIKKLLLIEFVLRMKKEV
ncbi:hypothetical protein, partial [Acinetobacter baumannii]|uniref:hypothetical protein n=1 Tax=Acinetobacter baumannii TaxID=470 RepID=UPI0011457DBF